MRGSHLPASVSWPSSSIAASGRHAGAIGALGGQGVEGVGDREEPGLEGDLLADEPARVAAAVEALVVVEDAVEHRLRGAQGPADLPADDRMGHDLGELLGRQRGPAC